MDLYGQQEIDSSKIHLTAEVVEYFWKTEDGKQIPDYTIKMKKGLHRCTSEDFNDNNFERNTW
jgi:hypothetical protein